MKKIAAEKNLPEKRITGFIKEHHVFTLTTVRENVPWCCNCFYAYLEDENTLVFTSDDDTRHVKEFMLNGVVAGSIVLETKMVGKIQGIQFTGRVSKPVDEELKKCRRRYLRRFPYAALMETSLWILDLEYIKMTDNRLGFGKKLVWEK